MAQTTYQVILSTDGKHTVIVSSDDPVGIKAAGAWAKSAYAELVNRYGPKSAPKQAQPDEDQIEEAPICQVHQVPMIQVNGRKGPFWSCHERVGNGWCTYRPAKGGA